MAQMSRRKDVSQLRLDLKEGKKGWDLGSVKTGIAFQENYFQGWINKAKEKLQKAQGQEGK